MIYLTIGTQLPFDRLVRSVDEWAAVNPHMEIIGQIGPGHFKPRFKHFEFVSPADAMAFMDRATLIVAHAGMGSILSALGCGKPIIVMPRRADLGEHRNDHQLATVQHLGERKGIHVVYTQEDLFKLLDNREHLTVSERLSPVAPPKFIKELRRIIDSE